MLYSGMEVNSWMKLPNPMLLSVTAGVWAWCADFLSIDLFAHEVRKEFYKQPDEATDGGNDKFFFSFSINGQRFFAAANEIGGLTVMFPEEY